MRDAGCSGSSEDSGCPRSAALGCSGIRAQGTDPTAEGFDPLLAVLKHYQLDIGADNFDFEGSQDQKNFAAWRGDAPQGEQA